MTQINIHDEVTLGIQEKGAAFAAALEALFAEYPAPARVCDKTITARVNNINAAKSGWFGYIKDPNPVIVYTAKVCKVPVKRLSTIYALIYG
jgi:hypothetical protein